MIHYQNLQKKQKKINKNLKFCKNRSPALDGRGCKLFDGMICIEAHGMYRCKIYRGLITQEELKNVGGKKH